MKKLEISFLDFDDIRNPLLNAGQARATYEVARRLVKRGHKVTSICSRYPGYKDRTEAGVVYKHIGLGSRFIRLNNFFYIFALPFMVRKLSGDIVIECFTSPISTLFSPLFTKTPVVVLPSMFNAKEFSKKYHLPFHWIEKFGMRFYKYIMPYSDVDSAKAKFLNPNIIYKIIPEGVGEEYFKIKHKKPKHILFLGRFDIAQKGIDLLLKSYSKVADKINYPLVIAGHGSDESKIRNLIEMLGLSEKVKMVGSAYGAKKRRLMSEALFVAFPSRHDEMCLWTLEALAGSLPIVCFDLPESSWLNDKVSLKTEPFDITKYSELLLVATDSKLSKYMSKKARKFAKGYSWDESVEECGSFFKTILRLERSSSEVLN